MAWTWQMTAAGTTTGDASAQDASAQEEAEPAASGDAANGDTGLFGAPTNGFASQADAETWLGTIWRELAAEGVSAASLFEDDRLVYGPMSLERPESSPTLLLLGLELLGCATDAHLRLR